MKITNLILFLTINTVLFAQELTMTDKSAFADLYRKQVDLAKIHPNKLQVMAIFVDLDNDKKPEALATSYESFYETGWVWSVYRMVGSNWVPIKKYNPETKELQAGSGVYARPDEIYRLVESDNNVQFVVLNRNYDKQASNGLGTIIKSVFKLDSNGNFIEDKIDNLEHLLMHRGESKSGSFSKMELLTVEKFSLPSSSQIKEDK